MELQNLVYFYILTKPKSNSTHIYTIWQKSKIFRVYERPEKQLLDAWVLEIKTELLEKGIRLKMN